MELISPAEYNSFISAAENVPICRVYPLSIAEGFQSGRIYRFGNCILFRHRNNFSFFTGIPDEASLRDLHSFTVSAGLKLMCSDEAVCAFLDSLGGVELIPRDIYSYPCDSAPHMPLPEGYTLSPIDRELFGRLEGRVPPSLYWRDSNEYLENGMGVCVMHEDEPAAWAFTSAVSSTEADIGIETAELHRKRGLAAAAVAALIREILPERRPTWTCQRSNHGSSRTAEKLGFVKSSQCMLLRKPL